MKGTISLEKGERVSVQRDPVGEDRSMKKTILLLFPLMLGVTTLAHSAQPLDALQGPMEEILSILKDPQQGDGTQKTLQREKIWGIIEQVFDFTELAKHVLARNWNKLTPQEKEEFTEVFARFLGRIYLDKIQGNCQNERIVYMGQDLLTDSKALVKTKIITETAEIPVNYRMKARDGSWRIYDVNIEGVSLVKNYRAQFHQILSKKSPARLIELLKKKLKT
jgi:phospholipid transport system substrate-binding protein